MIISDNSLKGTIPSELGQLEELIHLGMSYDELSGTIPSSLGQLNNLVNFELNNNALTGSVSLEIANKTANKTYDNFNVYGNKLSNLTDVDGLTICTLISNDTDEDGEHYCNCGSDCLNENGNRCECEEAQVCCDNYIEQNNITNCVVCEAGFLNPELIVPEWGYASCNDALGYIYDTLAEFGTEEQCNGGKLETNKRGCVCPGFVVPSKEEDDIQV